MRDFKGMKRQRGRNRGGGSSGGKPSGGGGGGNNANRAFDSNGPDGVKIRGHAQHIYEKYQQLSRDAASAGDRVLLENYLQHAEHYYRLIRTIQPQRQPAEIMGRDSFANGYDIDFEDESGEPLAGAMQDGGDGGEGQMDGSGDGGEGQYRTEPRREEPRRDQFPPREGRDREFSRDGRGDGQREFRGERDGPRGEYRDRPERGDQPRSDQPRGDQPRGDQPRGDQPRGERPRRDREFGRDERPQARSAYGERRDERREAGPETESEAPPMAAAPDEDGQVLRDASGGFSPAPAFLQSGPPPVAAAEEERPPRRRRRARDTEAKTEGGEDAAPAETEEV